MQPCPVCGGMGIDVNGYCTQCRTYRGLPAPAQPPTGTGFQPRSYDLVRPAGGSPAPSGQPEYRNVAYPPTTTRVRRSPLLVPLLALSATLVVIVVAIVVVVLVKSRTPSGPPVANPSASGLVDACLIGSWEETAFTEQVPVEQVGNVTFTGKGATVKLRSDGTGVYDYGSGTTYRATVNGVGVQLVVRGRITFEYRTVNGTVTFNNSKAEGSTTLTVPGVTATSRPLQANEDPARYTCSRDTLKEVTSVRAVELTRRSRTA